MRGTLWLIKKVIASTGVAAGTEEQPVGTGEINGQVGSAQIMKAAKSTEPVKTVMV